MVRSRSLRLRTKIIALLFSLVALWGFAAYVTLRDGLNLLWVATLDQKFGRPTDVLLTELAAERRLTVVYLGNPGPGQRATLDGGRGRVDAARSRFGELVGGRDVRLAASSAAEQRIDQLRDRLRELDQVRTAVNARSVSRDSAATAYTGIIEAGFRIYNSLASLDDPTIAKDGRTVVALTRARELLAQEDALLAGALSEGQLTPSEHARFVQLAGAQRYLYAEAVAELPDEDRSKYATLVGTSAFATFRAIEDQVIASGSTVPPVSAEAWRAASEPLFAALRQFEFATADAVVSRATPAAVAVIVRLLLAGGLGLLAVIASIILSITTARRIVAQLQRLRGVAWELANERLPRVVERLRRGEAVNPAAESPPLAFGTDEIGQVGQAFNAVRETAIRVAVGEAELRRSVRDVFLSLAHRTQGLVHRQLKLLDAMERRETEVEELEALFRVDHLATRMRRNAENLIVLSGASPGRGWRRSVPFVDVVRAAIAEVEDYPRVTVLPMDGTALEGRAVGDVIHLLAELVENALSFSPPYTSVQVGGQPVANGFAIEVEDRGLGMSAEDLAAANEQVTSLPEFHLTSTARLGLFVVGRLAERQGIRVHFRASPYGGTTVIVLVPSTVVIQEDPPARFPDALELDVVPVSPAVPALTEPAPEVADPGPGSAQDLAGRPQTLAEAPAELTPLGLPRRIRAAARDTEPDPASGIAVDPSPDPSGAGATRSPDRTRTMMASYQAATVRGRTEAARTDEPGNALEGNDG